MKHDQVFQIDLTKIEGSGDFACPNCGVMISPEDETENAYTILETKMKKEFLEELIIQCNRCGSRMHLVGFLPSSPSSLK